MIRKLQVCTNARPGPGTSCGARDGGDLLQRLAQAVAAAGLLLPVEPEKCLVRCEQGSNVRLLPDGRFWHRVGEHQVAEIVA